MEGCDNYHPNDRTAFYVLMGSYFAWWTIHLILKTYCNTGPQIRRTVSLQEMQEHVDAANRRQRIKSQRDDHIVNIIDNLDLFDTNRARGTQEKQHRSTEAKKYESTQSSNVFNKLTKSLDSENRYRIRRGSALLFTKVIFTTSLLLLSIVGLIANPSFLVEHFWNLNSCTRYANFLQYAAALIASAHAWECSTLSIYASVHKAIYVNHWVTVFAATNILFGLYSPIATNYGILHIALNIPAPLCGAFRFQCANMYPNVTRRMCKFATVWTIILIIISWITSLIIVSRAFMLGFDEHNISIWSTIMYIVAMIGWGYDDFHALQKYWQWGHEKYEDADFDMNQLEKLATGRIGDVSYVTEEYKKW
eukprot:484824_1